MVKLMGQRNRKLTESFCAQFGFLFAIWSTFFFTTTVTALSDLKQQACGLIHSFKSASTVSWLASPALLLSVG